MSERPTIYATNAETVAALSALTDDDYVRLQLAARALWKSRRLSGSLGSPEGLLHEAIVQTVAPDATKRWRRGVDFMFQLKQAMRNISGHAAGTEQRRAQIRAGELLGDLSETQRREAGRNPVERGTIARDLVRHLRDFFDPDQEAFDYIIYRHRDGMTESETGRELGIDGRRLEAVARRARRKVAAYLKQQPKRANQ